MKNAPANNRKGILCGGNWIIDQVKLIDAFPQRQLLANIRSEFQGTGGAPYNVAQNLAILGATFPIVGAGLVGKDALGTQILEHCKKLKIDTRYLRTTADAPTSYTDVMTETKGGTRTFFHQRGANALWDGKDIDFKKTKVKIFHLGYLLLLDKLDEADATYGTKAGRLLFAAQDAGIKTCVDCVSEDSDRFARVVPPTLKYVDYCIVNEFEAGKSTGFKLRDAQGKLDTVAVRHAAGAMLQLGVKDLVVIHFPEGGFARTRKGEDVWQMSLRMADKHIAGAAGAGDAFCSGVLLGLHEGWELQKCLHTGVCAATASLSHPTCTGGMKPLAACQALVKKFGFRPPLEPEH
jgi:sugar/nucleoside kinase (ribokinase family)